VNYEWVSARLFNVVISLSLPHLFMNHDIIRIQAETHPDNTPAQKVLEKNGFTREATIRKNTFSGGTWRDSTLFSLLREEWTHARPRMSRDPGKVGIYYRIKEGMGFYELAYLAPNL